MCIHHGCWHVWASSPMELDGPSPSSHTQLITANVSTMGVTPLPLDEVEFPLKVTFTYSASWLPTE